MIKISILYIKSGRVKKIITLMLQVILSDSLQLAHCLENCREGIHLNNLQVSPEKHYF